ncbi:hypothetical protein RHO95_25805, partial [Salmonella enterica subsp. enterica serovar Typhimurium]|nr:hypothetical protein [Salmonella enterica subsp. enterica serovar Typhimurium]
MMQQITTTEGRYLEGVKGFQGRHRTAHEKLLARGERRTEIPQNEYGVNGAQTLYIANQSPIEFWVGGRQGIRATDALDENFAGLHEPNARLLESV